MNTANCICKILKTCVPFGAMVAIYLIERQALNVGIDGIALTLSVGAICGLGGYEVKNLKELIASKVGAK